RFALEKRVAEFALTFGMGRIERPPHWTGYRVTPQSLEFWRDRAFRLHDRVVFARSGSGWTRGKLYP
ncbi:MAG: pyridoxine 5'-phosphate oxidase C-terminal domain-containing protein, partial [Asticcacaulis sp.]